MLIFHHHQCLKGMIKAVHKKYTAFIINMLPIYYFVNYALKAPLIYSINLVVDLEKT